MSRGKVIYFQMFSKRKFLCLLCFVSVTSLLLLYYNFTTLTTHQEITLALDVTPVVLLWTNTHYWKTSQLNHLNCELKCLFTYDRELFNISRGVMFYWRSIKSSDLPNVHREKQFWSLHHDEAPSYTLKLPAHFETEINWPVTYRRDSSIARPYGKVVKRKIPITYKFKTSFENKSRSIAWFVSHCSTASKREKFAKDLAEYIDIDIYGKCGKLSCGKQTYLNRTDTSCYRMTEQKYKFYFSAENSLCNDYITEKLFFLFDFEVIPIVYGGANYSNLLPKNSYIDTSNFSTPLQLAQFLHHVANNEELYYSYFAWKANYKVVHNAPWTDEQLPNAVCDVCKAIHNPSSVKDFKGVDINKWWFEKQCVK